MDVLQLGIMNPFGKQESEADYLGLIFSSLSGYNMKSNLWDRMKKLTGKRASSVFKYTPFK